MIRGRVAIVGRPNVGKSTLFNKLIRRNKAIVAPQPGVTRDQLFGTVFTDEEKNGFTLVDTGGFEKDSDGLQPFQQNLVWQKTTQAIEESDFIVLMYDGSQGLHPDDQHLTRFVQKLKKPVMFVANKMEKSQSEHTACELYAMGISDFHSISAAHNRGIRELIEKIVENLSSIELKHKDKNPTGPTVNVAIIGRPNAGKSSLLNRITNKDQALVSEVSGTTRDALDIAIRHNQTDYTIVDTAGVRRRTKVGDTLEQMSIGKSLRAIDKAQVVVYMIDADQGLTDQDAKLINVALSRYKPLLMIVNKWDLVENKNSLSTKKYQDYLHQTIKDQNYFPCLFISCIENQRVSQVMNMVEKLWFQSQQRVPTSKLNVVLKEILERNPPQLIRRYLKRAKFYYGTQVRSAPPTIVLKCNVTHEISEHYKRYLKNNLQAKLGFNQVPIKIEYRLKSEKHETEEIPLVGS